MVSSGLLIVMLCYVSTATLCARGYKYLTQILSITMDSILYVIT